ncbi:MAG TPA: hypothetical protein VGN07_05480 [Steroidobacteraceae bacterium]
MKRSTTTSVRKSSVASLALAAATTMAMFGSGTASAAIASEAVSPLKDGRIGYVLTDRYWAVYETKDSKTECPQGMNDGPREQFKILFPDNGTKRTVLETQLKREGDQWHPSTSPEQFTFKEAKGDLSYGMNLDGKVGPNDFQTPDGQKGIDNQLYRVIGCIANYRSSGTIYHFENEFMRRYDNTRVVIELSGVDNLTNDNDVTVTTYRGLDPLVTDATGNSFIPGGTQRIDMRWGKDYIATLKGKIVDGVLTTEPIDRAEVPWGVTFNTSGYQVFRGMRFQLKLTPQGAEGVMAGYVDVDDFTHHLNTSWSTHHHSYGQLSSQSEYRAMRRLADGYPDPKTGANTAISSAVTVKFTQVYIERPNTEPKTIVSKN